MAHRAGLSSELEIVSPMLCWLSEHGFFAELVGFALQVNYSFVGFFVVELVIRIYSRSWWPFIADNWNKFEPWQFCGLGLLIVLLACAVSNMAYQMLIGGREST